MIELDDSRVQQARVMGFPVIYGDATQPSCWRPSGSRTHSAILITIPAFVDVRAIATILGVFSLLCRSLPEPRMPTPFAHSMPSVSTM